MENYDKVEEEARKKLKKKRGMKVSGKSVFLLGRESVKDKNKKKK